MPTKKKPAKPIPTPPKLQEIIPAPPKPDERIVLVLDRAGGLLTFTDRDGKTIECPIRPVHHGWNFKSARLYKKIADQDLEEAVSGLFSSSVDVIDMFCRRWS